MKASARSLKPSLARSLRRGGARAAAWRRGSVSIELAAAALPLFLIISGTIEIGLTALNAAVLDGATRDAARQIRTGQAQTSGDPIATFRDRLCNQVSGMIDCARIVIDVRNFPNFAAVSVPPLYDASGNAMPTSFQPGDAGEIVVVRSSLRWRFQTPLLSSVIGPYRDIDSAFVFRNEPYKGPL